MLLRDKEARDVSGIHAAGRILYLWVLHKSRDCQEGKGRNPDVQLNKEIIEPAVKN